eukprot:1570366-Rhodomonas_salina.1
MSVLRERERQKVVSWHRVCTCAHGKNTNEMFNTMHARAKEKQIRDGPCRAESSTFAQHVVDFPGEGIKHVNFWRESDLNGGGECGVQLASRCVCAALRLPPPLSLSPTHRTASHLFEPSLARIAHHPACLSAALVTR